MRLLNLEENYRRWLFNKNALGFDSSLNEKLIGLSHEESLVFTHMASITDFPMNIWEKGSLSYFLYLEEKHRSALTNGFIDRRVRSR